MALAQKTRSVTQVAVAKRATAASVPTSVAMMFASRIVMLRLSVEVSLQYLRGAIYNLGRQNLTIKIIEYAHVANSTCPLNVCCSEFG